MKLPAPKFKGKQSLYLTAGSFVLIAILGVSVYAALAIQVANSDPVFNSGSDKTNLIPVPIGNNGNTSPTPTPINPTNTYPTPTPYIEPIWDPTGPTIPPQPTPIPTAISTPQPIAATTPTPAPTTKSSVLLWQTLYITNVDGPSYWVNPKQPFSLASVFGSQSGSGGDFTRVSAMQNAIYVKVPRTSIPTGQQIQSWSFHCKESILVKDANQKFLGYVCSGRSVDVNGRSLAWDNNVPVTGASVNTNDLQSILRNAVQGQSSGFGTLHLVIVVTEPRLTVTMSDGNTYLLQPHGTTSNTLDWLIQVRNY